jgi:hypothetical protein
MVHGQVGAVQVGQTKGIQVLLFESFRELAVLLSNLLKPALLPGGLVEASAVKGKRTMVISKQTNGW